MSLGDRGVDDFFPRDGHLIPEVERQQQKETHRHDDHENNQDHPPEGELGQCRDYVRYADPRTQLCAVGSWLVVQTAAPPRDSAMRIQG